MENMWCNVSGVMDCKKTLIFSILWKILVYELKQSQKWP